jgi:hypothetical protein
MMRLETTPAITPAKRRAMLNDAILAGLSGLPTSAEREKRARERDAQMRMKMQQDKLMLDMLSARSLVIVLKN